MKKNLLITTVAVGLVAAASAHANLIIGDVSFSASSFTTDVAGPPSSSVDILGKKGTEATTLKTVTGAHVDAADGDFAALVTSPATAATIGGGLPIQFKPPTQSFQLWQADNLVDTYTFYSIDQLPATFAYAGAAVGSKVTSIALAGDGYVVETADVGGAIVGEGFGGWTLDLTQTGGALHFQSTTGTVPDGGMTVALLGGGLIGIGALRRKLGR